MVSSVLYNLPMLFVVAGLVLFATSWHIRRRAQGYRRRMKNLLQLAGRDIEPLELPAAAWPELADGGWKHLAWQGTWFGQPVSGTLGEALDASDKRTSPMTLEISGGDEVYLSLSLTHAAPRGETRMFAEHLARVFVLLLESRLHTRTEALSAALAERARLSLYLQHDMRNLAQWVGWVSADFTACTTPEALLVAAGRLRDNAPLARERAERLTAALGKQPAADHPCQIDLRQAVTQAARLAGVEPDIVGEAHAWIAEGLLQRALDNLFSNLAAVWRGVASARPTLWLRTTGDMTELEFLCPWPMDIAPLAPEKIFEPFASGRPGGLGLGLYQARKSLREAGGDLHATPSPNGLSFVLRIPAQTP